MENLIDHRIEEVLRNTILPDLRDGRKDFDRQHTEAVVYWMKKLLTHISNPLLDSQVLITAAYAHDWGYAGLFDGINSNDIDEITKRKSLHMEAGARLIEKLIHSKLAAFFTTEQAEQTSELVRIHDQIDLLKTEEEILIMEADTLGMLDVSRVKPTFSKQDNEIFIRDVILYWRLPRFMHQFAIENCWHLIDQRLRFYSLC